MRRPDSLSVTSILAVLSAVALSLLGFIMTGNAVRPAEVLEQSWWNSPMTRQSVALAIGLGLMWMFSQTTFDRLRALALPASGILVVLLILVLVPGIGAGGGGACRRLALGFVTIQPSEPMKLAMVLALAVLCTRPSFDVKRTGSYVFVLALIFTVCLLVEREPDLGTAAVIFGTSLAVLYVAGARPRHIAVTLATGAVALGLLTLLGHGTSTGYRVSRWTAYVAPEDNMRGVAYQVVHSLIAVSASGLGGVGLGNGQSKHFLPASNTDYVMATVAEELGIGGILFVMLCIGLIFLHAHRVVVTSSDPFTKLVASGVGALLVFQSALNLAVVTNSVPSTGVPMPFVSYGSSALITMLAAVGVISRPLSGLRSPVVRPARSAAT